MAVGFVQGKTTNGTGTSQAITPTSAVTAGNLLVGTMRAGNGASQAGLSVTDSSNTWNIVDTPSDNLGGSGDTMQTDYAANVASGSYAVTFNATSNGASSFRAILEEYSGVATASPLNDHGMSNTPAIGSSFSATTGGATTNAGDLVWLAVTSNATTYTFADTAGDVVPAAPSTRLGTQWRAATVGGSQTSTITGAISTNWAAGIVTFKAASGGGTAPNPPSFRSNQQAVNRASTY